MAERIASTPPTASSVPPSDFGITHTARMPICCGSVSVPPSAVGRVTTPCTVYINGRHQSLDASFAASLYCSLYSSDE